MPPKLIPIPVRTMTTRTSNKDAHPDLVDLEPAQRTLKIKKEIVSAKEMEEKVAKQARAAERAASIEDLLLQEDKEFERCVLLTPAKFKGSGENQVPGRSGKQSARKDEGDIFVTSESDQIQVSMVSERVLKAPVCDEKKLAHRHKESDDDSSDSTESTGSDDCSESIGSGSDTNERARKRKRKDKAKAKKAKKAKKATDRFMKHKKISRGDIEQLRATEWMGAEASKKGKASKSKLELADSDVHGIDLEWKNMISQRGDKRKMTKLMKNVTITNDIDNFNSVDLYGGFIPEALASPSRQEKMLTPTAKIDDNPIVDQSLVQTRGGDRKWKLCHLGDKEIQNKFTESVVPRIRMKAGNLNPWAYLDIKEVQAIVDDVFGAGMHKVVENGPWMGLTTARLQNWRNGFSQHAMDTIELLLNQNKEELNTKDRIKMQIDAYLEKSPIRPGSEHSYYAYQWLEWDKKEGFMENMLILRTFGLAHLAYFDDNEKFESEKPVGALILAMQAVGRALELWKTGEKLDTKPQPFSADLHDDTYIKTTVNGRTVKTLHRRATIFVPSLQKFSEDRWKTIIEGAREHVSKPKKAVRSRVRGSSSIVVEDLIEEDPDADFSMDVD